MSTRTATFLCLITIVLGSFDTIRPQQPENSKTPASNQTTPIDQDDVVRITTNLVQIDAVVTDRDGHVVTNLNPSDFNLMVNGKKQQITSFSFNGITAATEVTNPLVREKTAPPAPNLRPRQIGNTFAIVVDDYCMAFEYFVTARKLAQKFVDEKLRPNDAAAIISTRAGTGTLQQFTTDHRLLNAAIQNLRWHPCRNADDPASSTGTGSDDAAIQQANSDRESEALKRNAYGVTAIGTLDYVAQGLQDMPGRKAIVMLSEGLPILSPKTGELDGDVLVRLRRVIEKANRASAVIYTIHLRGLDPLFFNATDGPNAFPASAVSANKGLLASRRKEFNLGQDGLIYAAENTGGFAIRNTNDFSGGISKVVEDQRGYYLIGYRPEDGTFHGSDTQFNSIKITLNNHSDYRVRTRNGFSGVASSPAKVKRTPADQLVRALRSPVGADGLTLRMTSLFANSATNGLQLRSLLYLESQGLSFRTDTDGSRVAEIDIAIVTLGADGSIVDKLTRTQTIRVRSDMYERIIKEGLVYVLDVPVKNPGPYEMRVAVRDHGSERVGSARQFVEVPDLNKDRLVVSGLVVSGHQKTQAQASQKVSTLASATPELASASGPAVRKFNRNTIVDYGFEAFGAKLSEGSELTAQMRVLRDGRVAFQGQPQRVLVTSPKGKSAEVGGSFELGPELPPGWYTLEVSVSEGSNKKPSGGAVQWIDFEVVD